MSAMGRRLRLMCRKTEFCRFYRQGACKRGAACDFAHEAQDVRSKPDLQRTKSCPAQVNGQRCENPTAPSHMPPGSFAGSSRGCAPRMGAPLQRERERAGPSALKPSAAGAAPSAATAAPAAGRILA
ncbi:unnamed protein product [Prorocentrum cordatum]|uniref:C3H1-type domain-containing protein n=1 Tax=Prorocentrum cordatum TaxID=2364126 RepID=A0ABN9UBM8_9DINO|nr:unnamed protein product [Polarella glacialis]